MAPLPAVQARQPAVHVRPRRPYLGRGCRGRREDALRAPGPTDSGLQAKTADAGATGILDRYIIGSTLKAAHAVEDGALGLLRAALDADAAGGDFYGPEGRGKAGPAVRLPAERDAPAQETLWWESMATTGLTDFFAGR